MEKEFFKMSPEYLLMQGYEKDVNLYFKRRENMDDICVIHAVKRDVYIATLFKSDDQSFKKIVKSGNDLYLFEIVTGLSSPSDDDYHDWVE